MQPSVPSRSPTSKTAGDRRRFAFAAAAIFLFYLVLGRLGITCPIRFLTGISCAGCGMCRAWLALLAGDLPAAWAFHPLFWLPPVGAALWLLRRRIPRPMLLGLEWGAVCLFLAVYACRMADGQDPIVFFCPEQGLLWQMAEQLLGFIASLP